VNHISEEALEQYAMRTLPEAAELGRLEEHLLICSACRNRLQMMDDYVAAMRSAAAKLRSGST
jgi:anti-sigma factor RsiW